ncbi:hypothetical protein Glove_230g164 [Diversispora epigaea]|uniref:BTB domain-containing protein n=1 Tax=Diversispora epigaea TaxID=1348612 RepID=A0A397ID31_9GLOM|nr:hypothetical protein Glove_230g164 [Diversispora epigaea]
MAFKFLEKLSQDFSELLNDKEEYNVIIEVGQEQSEKTFTAHSAILRYRSSYFNKELSNTVPSDDNNKIIIKPYISAQIFEIILKYIYLGIVDTENMDNRTIYDLMVVANELEFEELSDKLENHLIESKASWLRTHFTFVYHSIFKYNKFKNLENFCNDIIAKHPSTIFESAKFTSLHESALISILKRDDLQMKESEIWDYVIKWGTAQNSTLPEKLEEWSDENFTTLKTTLQQCLPLIRYFHIPNPEVVDKIKPYKKILDKELWNDLKQYLILPDRPIKSIILPQRLVLKQEFPARVIELFSTLINEEHASMISSWIDYRSTSYSSRNNPYEFQLILQGSKDGFAPRTFWNICGGQANTIVVAKVKGADEIIGGFNPLAWDETKEEWMGTNKSFIFSFKNGNIQNSILSRIKKESMALWYPQHKGIFGPIFGRNEFMMRSDVSDFTQGGLSWCGDSNYCYEKPIRATKCRFSILDYELFFTCFIIYSSRNNPYEFQLILQGSKDGFAPRTFWNICGGQANTIVVAKVKGADEIIGGFNPLAWDETKEEWMGTNKSFIFSFKNGNIQNSILSRIKKESMALWYPQHKGIFGPIFGRNEFMMRSDVSDFTQGGLSWCGDSNYCYEKPIRATKCRFSILDYETSQLSKIFEKEPTKSTSKQFFDFSELLTEREKHENLGDDGSVLAVYREYDSVGHRIRC